MLGGLGLGEMVLLFLVVLLLFGSKRLPRIGPSVGNRIREVESSLREVRGALREGGYDIEIGRVVRPVERGRGGAGLPSPYWGLWAACLLVFGLALRRARPRANFWELLVLALSFADAVSAGRSR